MSLRIILSPEQVSKWIADRHGTPVRSEDGYRITFEPTPDQKLTVDELLDAMKLNHLVMLVEQEPERTFHKIYAHS
jgi:hypothetical protein